MIMGLNLSSAAFAVKASEIRVLGWPVVATLTRLSPLTEKVLQPGASR